MKYTFVGDCMIQQPFSIDYTGCKEIYDFIKKGDFRFFNLETTLNKMGSCPGNQFSGGSYLRADEQCLESVLEFPFNITSFNNNHAFDFTVSGFLETMEILKKYKIPYSGTGCDLREATKPVYFKSGNQKSALISINTTFDNSMVAGDSSPCFKGRPGVNGLHIKSRLKVTKRQFEIFKEVAEQSKINAADDADRATGYLPELKDNEFVFGNISMELSDKTELVYYVDDKDKSRIESVIKEAKENADEIVISIHTHQQTDIDISQNPAFMEDFSRFCIDCGADIILCHGPHLVRGIEIYNDRPIFYSIGNFIMQLNSIPEAPADFYGKYGVLPAEGIKKLLDVRSKGGKIGLMYAPVFFEAIVPFVDIENGKLKSVKLLPIELGYEIKDDTRGLPRISQNKELLDRINRLSKKYNTEAVLNNNEIVVKKI